MLELIEGKSLQTAIAAGLPPATRLRIAQQIADVLVATHSAGVVHRDLKPANAMLTRLNEVKVLDFGLAQSSERTGFEAPLGVAAQADQTIGMQADPSVTRSHPSGGHVSGAVSFHVRTEGGVVMGTPAYMSPEQARGEPATPASDLYSFGLMLQELYTGRAPYPPGISIRELLERARNGDTLPPTGAPADIAALIGRLKQLVPAQRPTAVETAARLVWVRDRRRRIARRLLVAGVLLSAVLGAAKYTIDLARERTRAVAAREEADRRRTQAEDLIGFMLGDLRKRLEPVGRLEILDDVGQKAMAYFAAVPESALSDEELLRRSAALYQIGDVRIAQGNLEAATPPLQESLALARTLVERKPNDGERLFGLAQSHFWVGFVHWRRHNLDAAEGEFKAYLDVANRLTTIDARRDDWRREVAYANSNLGSVLEARGNLDAALVRYRAAWRSKKSCCKKAMPQRTCVTAPPRPITRSGSSCGRSESSTKRWPNFARNSRFERPWSPPNLPTPRSGCAWASAARTSATCSPHKARPKRPSAKSGRRSICIEALLPRMRRTRPGGENSRPVNTCWQAPTSGRAARKPRSPCSVNRSRS